MLQNVSFQHAKERRKTSKEIVLIPVVAGLECRAFAPFSLMYLGKSSERYLQTR